MRRLTIIVALVAAVATDLWAATASTPEERQKAVAAAKKLEDDPLGKQAKVLRGELLKWWIEVPDLTLNWCATMLLEVGETDMELAGAVVTQAPLSAGAAMIEDPALPKDKKAFAIAGVEGALRAYRSVMAKEPSHKNEFLEELQKEGAIAVYVDSKLPACK